MEHLPCHMRHEPPYEEDDCIYGHCLRCKNEHCAFDSCIPGTKVISVMPATMSVLEVLLQSMRSQVHTSRIERRPELN